MADLTQTLLEELTTEPRYPEFPWQEGQVPPAYHGLSILNLPTTVAQWLGAPPLGVAPALDARLRQPLGEDIRQVIVILIDGWGWYVFEQARQQGWLEPWEPWVEKGVLGVLTSIVPSTTAAAIPTLWTGRSPTEHGITGYEMWMKEYGVIANMILHSPSFFQVGPGLLEKAGFDPEKYLPYRTLGSHLRRAGVESWAFQHHTIANSGLSRMLFRDVQVVTFHALADLWTELTQALSRASTEQKRYIWVYWGLIDRFGHRYGPTDARIWAEIRTLVWTWQRFFLEAFPPEQRKGTVVVITADHGMQATPPRPEFEVKHHRRLLDMLLLPPTGENRFVYLYPKPRRTRSVQEYFQEHWPEAFTLVPSRDVLQWGLLGPGRKHRALHERVGQWIAVPRGDAYLWWSAKENELQGRHAGLNFTEMVVPFLAFRLDG